MLDSTIDVPGVSRAPLQIAAPAAPSALVHPWATSGPVPTPNEILASRVSRIREVLKQIHSSTSAADLLLLAMAVESGRNTPETDATIPLWLIAVGAPSTGKTSTVRNLLGTEEKPNENICEVSTMSPGALASAFIDPKGKKAENLLERLNNRCLLMGEMSALLSQPAEKVQKFLGDMCDIFDGSYNKWTGTVGVLSVKASFNLLGCITPAALKQHREYMSRIGSRFLMYELPPLTPEEEDLGFELKNAPQADQAQARKSLRALVAEHLEAVRAVDTPVQMSPKAAQLLKGMAQLVARGRGSVIHNETQVESAYRVYTQFSTLARSLARVSGHASVGAGELELVRRVALSTITAPRGKLLQLAAGQPDGVVAAEVATAIGYNEATAKTYLETMTTLELLVQTPRRSGKRGQPAYTWTVAPAFQVLLQPIEMEG
jgi:hypothetical protein